MNQALVPCPDHVIEEGFHGNYENWKEGNTFLKTPYEKDLIHENSRSEPQVNLTQKLWNHLPLKKLWGFGKKNISDDHLGVNITWILPHILEEPREFWDP